MTIAYEKTESLLTSFVEQITPKPQSWRVISIEFQECDTLHSGIFQNLCLKNLQHFFAELDCKIFWPRANFILIFFQGRAMPVEKAVEGFLKETEFKGFGRFFDILDLSIHWDNLQSLLQKILPQHAKISQNGAALAAPNSLNKTQPENRLVAPSQDQAVQDGFTITLSRDKMAAISAIRRGRTKPLLLLVEDDPFTLQLVKLAFKEGHEVITAETARQALVYYQRHLPDMVFLDIQLPDGNGIALLQEMTKADDEAYVVMLSSHSQKEKIMDCITHGAKGFIAKPFTRQRLMDAADKFRSVWKQPVGDNRHGT